MLVYIDILDNNQAFVVSSKVRGVIDYPLPLLSIARGDSELNTMDGTTIHGYGIKDIPNYTKTLEYIQYIKDYNASLTYDNRSKRKRNPYFRIYKPYEQVSYFMPDALFDTLFGTDTSNISKMSFDIEVGTKAKKAPDPNDDPIIMIGCSDVKTGEPIIIDHHDEAVIIKGFLDTVIQQDPDIITGYFSKEFDADFILTRMNILNIPYPDELHRLKAKQYPRLLKTFASPTVRRSFGYGRTHYDIYETVKLDTTVNTNNKKLKTVAAFMGSKDVYDIGDEEKGTMMDLYAKDKDRLITYLKSDIRQTSFLFNSYFEYISTLSIMAHSSLDAIVNSPGRAPFPRLYMNRAFIKRGKFPFKRNIDRLPEVFKLIEGGKYRGAYTGIKRTGRFNNICKVDFACVDEETEALTTNGWKRYDQITENDSIMIWDPNTNKLKFEIPQNINIYDYDEELITCNTKFISFAYTPNHRVYYWKSRGKNKGVPSCSEAQDLQTYIEIPIAGIYEHTIDICSKHADIILMLIAWIISEGHVSKQGIISISKRQGINDKYIDRIRELLLKADIQYRERKRPNHLDIKFFINKIESKKILDIMDNGPHGIPNIIFQKNYRFRYKFIQELVKGDESFSSGKEASSLKDGAAYVSKDAGLIGQIQLISHMSGFKATVSEKYDDQRNGASWYYIHLFKTNRTSIGLNEERTQKDLLYIRKQYKGKVWCPTVSTGAWMVRRSGKIHITGNSMYPSIIVTLNISPDTVRYISSRDIEQKEFNKEIYALDKGVLADNDYPCIIESQSKDHITLSFADDTINKYITVKIDRNKSGIIPTEITELGNKRKVARKKLTLAEKNSSEYSKLNSQQLAFKIASNALYGLFGNEYVETGDLPCAMIITAIGREISHYVTSTFGNNAIEIDTDGIYVDMPQGEIIDIDKLNKEITRLIKEKYWGNFKLPFEPILSMNIEKIGVMGLFLGMKNYILKDPKTGEIKATGSSLKGSSKSNFEMETIKKAGDLLINGASTVQVLEEISTFMDSNTWTTQDFKLTQSILKNMEDYKADGGLFMKLIEIIYSKRKYSLDYIKKLFTSSMRRELRITQERKQKQLAKAKQISLSSAKDYLLKDIQDMEDVVGNWIGATAQMTTVEHLISSAENIALTIGGYFNKPPNSLSYRILKNAISSGVHVIRGETIEYYHSISINGFELFTNENLTLLPIDKMKYKQLVTNTISKMVKLVGDQESDELF